MRKLTLTKEQLNSMLSGLIQSGVTFEAESETNKIDSYIIVIFTGGY